MIREFEIVKEIVAEIREHSKGIENWRLIQCCPLYRKLPTASDRLRVMDFAKFLFNVEERFPERKPWLKKPKFTRFYIKYEDD